MAPLYRFAPPAPVAAFIPEPPYAPPADVPFRYPVPASWFVEALPLYAEGDVVIQPPPVALVRDQVADPSEAEIFDAAGVNPTHRADMDVIRNCESHGIDAKEGDGGLAKGRYQIHWYPTSGWQGWFNAALRAGYVVEAERNLWADPVVNTKVARYVRESRGRFGGFGGWTCADLNAIY